jgi:hypothetical protein
MALQLRPTCEYCDKDLPPSATDARICSYECTFCADCVETKLFNVCPNCGGGFVPRPIRPSKEWAAGGVRDEACAVRQAGASEVQPRRRRGAFGKGEGYSAGTTVIRHCEERSDEAIHSAASG